MGSHQMASETQQELRRLPGNNRCVDCDAPYPQWATVSYGTFMCLECSGRHRGLGVHISFVRSVTMDSWTDKQIAQMQRGGNETFREAFLAAGVPTTLSIQQKYNTPQAEAYRQRLTAIVEGRPSVPLPRWDPSCIASSTPSAGQAAGVGDARGVEALKGETEQDYVARQLRLREEARARMQAKFGSGGMQGIGSGGQTGPPSYSGAGGITDLSSAFGYLSTTVTSVAGSAVNLVKDQDLGSRVVGGWSYVQSAMADPALKDNVKSTASTGWSALASGATAVWKTAQSAVNPEAGGSGGDMPNLHGGLAPSGKYSGIGSEEVRYNDSRGHDNDSWLDSQLSHGSPVKSNSFNGTATIKSNEVKSVTHANSFSSLSTSYDTHSPPPASTATATPIASPPLPPAPIPASATRPPPAEKKKDVDFFAEFGF